LMYSLACAELRLGNPDQAGTALQAAFARGLSARELHAAGTCLEEMKNEPLLRAMITRSAGEK